MRKWTALEGNHTGTAIDLMLTL